MTADEQQWDPGRYACNARFVSDLGQPVLECLRPRPGERLLDLGCGDGALTERLVAAGCAVVGVDASPEMVAAARGRGLDARVMDGRALDFDAEFDAVFSNAALHWMKPLEPVLAGAFRALRPGGRFVGEFGGKGNVATIMAALNAALAASGHVIRNPWCFPDKEEYMALLGAAGFELQRIELFPRPTPLPGPIEDWLETFTHPFMAPLAMDQRPAFVAGVAGVLRDALQDDDGVCTVDYVRLRFEAMKPAVGV